MKAFKDDKINVTEHLEFVFGKVANDVGKQENASYTRIFSFFHKLFESFFLKQLI